MRNLQSGIWNQVQALAGNYCGSAHNSGPGPNRSGMRERVEVMLIPSILRILDLPQLQTKTVERAESGFQAELIAAQQQVSGLEKIESEIAAAAELLKPLNSDPPHPVKSPKRSGLAELLRTITKFEKSSESRVVDFFE